MILFFNLVASTRLLKRTGVFGFQSLDKLSSRNILTTSILVTQKNIICVDFSQLRVYLRIDYPKESRSILEVITNRIVW